VVALARALQADEHEVRIIAVGKSPSLPDLQVRSIACRGENGSGIPFDVPWFGIEPEGELTFERLSADEFTVYRDRLRRDLDAEVEAFDPQIIHAQHVWLWAQLALETGVPYVVNAWGPEFVSRARDERYRPLADQAAENASRLFVPDEHVRREVLNTFEDLAQRTILLPTIADGALVGSLMQHYLTVLEDRFGS
jgi:hypothetical protein